MQGSENGLMVLVLQIIVLNYAVVLCFQLEYLVFECVGFYVQSFDLLSESQDDVVVAEGLRAEVFSHHTVSVYIESG